MTITIRPRWSLGHGKTLVPSRWQATAGLGPARCSVPTSTAPVRNAHPLTSLHPSHSRVNMCKPAQGAGPRGVQTKRHQRIPPQVVVLRTRPSRSVTVRP
jgi:hypothetical protein